MSSSSVVSDLGYQADTETYDKDLFNFVENGIITETSLKEEPEDEVPAQDEEAEKEIEYLNTQASQAVDNLEIKIYEEAEQLPPIQEEEETIARTKPRREIKPPQRYSPEGRKQPQKKKAIIKVSQKTIQTEEFNTQQVVDAIEDDTQSQATVSKKLIVENIRLETRKPDDQAKVIYGDDFDRVKNSPCYLCGFELSERVSFNHNKRWDYSHTAITSSYDHTAPVNFSFIVSRIPSQYNIGSINAEKPFLKSNGKFACFHCNFTKSQRMFITCPKSKGGNIDFQNFKPNDKAINKFLVDLYDKESDWSIGPKGEKNTLHKCINNYKGGKEQWIADRIQAITASANEVCTMIKKHVDQTSVMKRLYYTKLLIEKANEILQTDPVYLAQPKPKKKNTYAKKFIAHFVAKAEGTNPNFINPWKQETRVRYIPAKKTLATPVTLPSGETVIPTFIGTPIKIQQQQQQQQQEFQSNKRRRIGGSRRKHTRKSRRKTFRRIRLF